MKKIGILLIGIVVVVLILSTGKNMIVKLSIERMVGTVTGLRVNIESLNMGILKTNIGIRGIKLFNPRGFADKIMLDMPEIYVDYDLASIFRHEIHLKDMRIDMKEFLVVKNRDGDLNLNSLKIVKANREGKEAPGAEGSGPKMQIDSLTLKVGKVVYKDYSQGRKPVVKEFNINIDEKFTNITDLHSLVSIIMAKALARTTIAQLANFNIKLLKATVSKTIEGAGKVATRAVGTAEKALGGAVEGLKGAFKLPEKKEAR